jgi:anti-sigma B factor antagonist
MRIEEHPMGEVMVASVLEARVDARTGGDLKASIVKCVDSGHRRIVLDLTTVSFIDSTGLGALVASLRHVGRGGDLVLCGVNEAVTTLLKLTRMDKVFRTFPTRVEAVAALSASN